jgi:hypothetical protein
MINLDDKARISSATDIIKLADFTQTGYRNLNHNGSHHPNRNGPTDYEDLDKLFEDRARQLIGFNDNPKWDRLYQLANEYADTGGEKNYLQIACILGDFGSLLK